VVRHLTSSQQWAIRADNGAVEICNARDIGRNGCVHLAHFGNNKAAAENEQKIFENARIRTVFRYEQHPQRMRRNELLSKVQNPELEKAIKELYRPTAEIPDGGTADAILYFFNNPDNKEISDHIRKGESAVAWLAHICQKNSLCPSDKNLAYELINDLNYALEKARS